MKVTIEIELGNDAMRQYSHIRKAMREIMAKENQWNGTPKIGDGAKIRDVNGNTVGKWQVTE